MLKSSRQTKDRRGKSGSEFNDYPPAFDLPTKPTLPRHISGLESWGHGKDSKRLLTVSTNRRCPLDAKLRAERATNLAVNILCYQLENSSQQQHWENLRRNLKHRLAAAVATKNEELVGMLEREFEQLKRDRVSMPT